MVPIHTHLAEELVAERRTEISPAQRAGWLTQKRIRPGGTAENPASFQDASHESGWYQPLRSWLISCVASRPACAGIFFCLSLLLSAPLSHAADYDAQFNKWFEVQTNLQSWSGEFTQTRTLSVLNQPLITPGKVWVKPGEFRWELGQPVQSIILRTPDALLIVYPRFKRAEKYSLGVVPSGPMKDALALMDASLPRDRASMEEHFKLVSADLTNSILQMRLQPRSESARKMIGQVMVGFRTNDYLIAETEMKFADGSTLHNNFTNIVVNQPLAPELFDEKLPADYTVSEPLKQ